jgi:large subunit ribosomal protein L29
VTWIPPAEETMETKELRVKDATALNKELQDLLKAQFSLRMQKATQQLQNTSQMRKVRRDIARVRTVLTEKATAK